MTFGPHGKKAVTWWGATVPPTGPVGTSATWVGWRFGISQDGRMAGVRLYVPSGEDGGCLAFLVQNSAGRDFLAATKYHGSGTGLTGNQWVSLWFRPWVRLSQSTDYVLGVWVPSGHFFRQNTALSGGVVTHNGIDLTSGWQSTTNAWFLTNPTFNTNANAIDILYYLD